MAAKEAEKKLLFTKDVASRLKTDPKTLRRILRTLPRYKSGEEYNRYTWDESNAADKKFLITLPDIVSEHLRSEKESKEKKASAKATPRKEAPTKGKKTKLPPKKKAKKKAVAAEKKTAPSEEIEEAVESTGEVESGEVEELN